MPEEQVDFGHHLTSRLEQQARADGVTVEEMAQRLAVGELLIRTAPRVSGAKRALRRLTLIQGLKSDTGP